MAAADAQLALLGCKWRLSQAVWAAAATAAAEAVEHTNRIAPAAQQQQACDTGGSGVLLHDAPLSSALLHAVQQAFHSSSDFWSSHSYGDDATPFFSYVIDLQAAAAAGPSNAIEAAAMLLQQELKQLAHAPLPDSQQQLTSAPAAAAAAATHVEWWAHTRPACAPHQLHFDAAEGAFRRGLAAFRLAHPAASSVLYLTGAGGPTLVLGQTTAGAVTQPEQHDVQQQQQQQQQQQESQQQPLEAGSTAPAPAAGADDGAPAAKRAKLLDSTAEEQAPAAMDEQGQHRHKHHHHHHHHHQHSELDQHQHQQQRPPLASHAWLMSPAAGRFALWPGCLLHGVLPGAVMPLGEDADSDDDEDAGKPSQQQHKEQQQQLQQQQQQLRGRCTQGDASIDGSGGDNVNAAAGTSNAAGDALRTTLILAWWSCDPRTLVAQQQQQQQPGEAAQTAAAALPAGDGSAPAISRLGPCMAMPVLDSSGNSCGAAPVWLQALAGVAAAELAAAKHTAAAASGDTHVSSAGWQLLPACCPAWEQVQPHSAHPAAVAAAAAAAAGTPEQQSAAAEAAAGHQFGMPAELLRHPLLCRADLPCLRFFLRSSRDIRAAYIPDIEAWQQPAATGAAAEMPAAVEH
jgi:hypothetical protein